MRRKALDYIRVDHPAQAACSRPSIPRCTSCPYLSSSSTPTSCWIGWSSATLLVMPSPRRSNRGLSGGRRQPACAKNLTRSSTAASGRRASLIAHRSRRRGVATPRCARSAPARRRCTAPRFDAVAVTRTISRSSIWPCSAEPGGCSAATGLSCTWRLRLAGQVWRSSRRRAGACRARQIEKGRPKSPFD